jgi:hypothetical protein
MRARPQCVRARARACVYVCIYVNTHTCTETTEHATSRSTRSTSASPLYIYICTHTHTYTYIHTHKHTHRHIDHLNTLLVTAHEEQAQLQNENELLKQRLWIAGIPHPSTTHNHHQNSHPIAKNPAKNPAGSMLRSHIINDSNNRDEYGRGERDSNSNLHGGSPYSSGARQNRVSHGSSLTVNDNTPANVRYYSSRIHGDAAARTDMVDDDEQNRENMNIYNTGSRTSRVEGDAAKRAYSIRDDHDRSITHTRAHTRADVDLRVEGDAAKRAYSTRDDHDSSNVHARADTRKQVHASTRDDEYTATHAQNEEPNTAHIHTFKVRRRHESASQHPSEDGQKTAGESPAKYKVRVIPCSPQRNVTREKEREKERENMESAAASSAAQVHASMHDLRKDRDDDLAQVHASMHGQHRDRDDDLATSLTGYVSDERGVGGQIRSDSRDERDVGGQTQSEAMYRNDQYGYDGRYSHSSHTARHMYAANASEVFPYTSSPAALKFDQNRRLRTPAVSDNNNNSSSSNNNDNGRLQTYTNASKGRHLGALLNRRRVAELLQRSQRLLDHVGRDDDDEDLS